jgi:predicted metal-dependent hydrolase
MEDFEALTPEENHRLGVQYFEAGRFFPAHEAWETSWKQSKGTADAEFFKGMSQMGAGYVHLLRGNKHGAYTLMRRAAGRIQPYGPEHRGVEAERLAAEVLAHADDVEAAEQRGAPMPNLRPPRVSGP